jgi:hypothetical protein
MSSSRRAGFSEGKGAVPINLSLEPLFANRLFDNIHLAAENFRKAAFEIVQAADVIETSGREILTQAHHDIDILRGVLSTGDRAEKGHAYHASSAELLFVRLQGANDLVAVHGFILPIPFRPVKALMNSKDVAEPHRALTQSQHTEIILNHSVSIHYRRISKSMVRFPASMRQNGIKEAVWPKPLN